MRALIVAALVRAKWPLVDNHRYHFTTSRLAVAAAWVLEIGFALKAASLLA
jgi:hypothetical protein